MRTRGQRRGPVIVDNWNAWALRGLVGWWCPSATSPTGLSLLDISGNNNTGTLTNMDAPTDWVQNGGKTALDFDGSNDFVSISTGSILPLGSSQRTVATWFKLNANTNALMFSYGGNSGAGQRFSLWRNGATVGLEANGNSVTGPFTYDTNWHHLVVVKNGSSTSLSSVDVYLDGNALSTTVSGSASINTLATDPVIGTISGANTGTGYNWNGQLDSIRVYNRELTSFEIRLLYAGGRGFGLLNFIRRYPMRSTGNRRRRVLLGAEC